MKEELASVARTVSGARLLICDDDAIFRERLGRAFRDRQFAVTLAANAAEALGVLGRESPDLAVIDLRMPGRSGLDLLQDLLRCAPKLKVVILTGYGSIATAVDAIRLGAINYVPKPADVDDILAAFERAPEGEGTSLARRYQAPSLARAEWEHINRVLADCSSNISEAARRLGIHRRSLQRKLQKYPPRL